MSFSTLKHASETVRIMRNAGGLYFRESNWVSLKILATDWSKFADVSKTKFSAVMCYWAPLSLPERIAAMHKFVEQTHKMLSALQSLEFNNDSVIARRGDTVMPTRSAFDFGLEWWKIARKWTSQVHGFRFWDKSFFKAFSLTVSPLHD